MCISIFLNLIYRIYHIVLIHLFHSKIDLIIIFINVFEDVFANFDVNAYFHINVNIIFNRQIRIIKHYLTILFKFIF